MLFKWSINAGHLDAGIRGGEGGGQQEGGGGEGKGALTMALAVIREGALSFRQHAGTPYVAA